MKKYFLGWIIGSVVGIAIAVMISVPHKAECAWCPSYKCYGSNSCGGSCSCVTIGGEMGGQCVSVELKGVYLSQGYRELW